MYQDVVYAILRCLQTDLPEPLRHGADDLLAEAAGDRLDIALFCRNYPRERSIVLAVAEILSGQFGYGVTDWTLELRRSPERVLLALSKSKFLPVWQERVRISLGQQAKPEELVALLTDPDLDLESNLGQVTADALIDYAEGIR